jgi:radical SAM superfamily enzyme YgiQ (UPF0313 family)
VNIFLLNPPYYPRYSRDQRSPAVTKGGTIYYPFWLAFAAGLLEENGYRVILLDAPAAGISHEDTTIRVREASPDLIVVNTSTPSIYNDISCAELLKKENPGVFLLLVGTHVSALPEETMALSKSIDGVAIGEYDNTVLDLAGAIKEKSGVSDVSGLCLRQGDRIYRTSPREYITDLDQLPFLSRVYKRHLNIYDYYFAAADYPMVMLITGRGCPSRCFYCVYPQVFHGHRYRSRSPENIAAEFAYISKELPRVREIGIEDDTFTVDKERVRTFCRLLLRQKNTIKWYANVRADLDYEILALMKRAGCRLVTVGFESGDQTILDNMRKGLRVEQFYRFMRGAKKAGILVHGCIMAGNPGDTMATLEKSYQMAKILDCDSMQFYPLIVYPGTDAYRWASENKYLISKDYSRWLTPAHAHNCVLDFPHLSRDEILNFCEHAYNRYHFNLRYLTKKLYQSVRHPSEGRRTFRSGMNYLKYLLRARLKNE